MVYFLDVGQGDATLVKTANEAFLFEVTPAYAVICVDEDNSYGHPAQQKLDRLADNSVTTLWTDTIGTIIMDQTASAAPDSTPVLPEFPTLVKLMVLTLGCTIVAVSLRNRYFPR